MQPKETPMTELIPGRRAFLRTAGTLLAAAPLLAPAAAAALHAEAQAAAGTASAPQLLVAKSPTCGCCGAWVAHMREAGFRVAVRDVSDAELQTIKLGFGVRPEYASCHTARVGGYVIEGHVPAADVRRLLAERPGARGLAVPGMPLGSPGMESGDGTVEPYATLLLLRDGGAEVFARHG
jgi:hypothetical protein